MIHNRINRHGFSLDWPTVFLGICGLGFAGVIFSVGLAYGVGVLCD
jgi:hypothetical protein